MEDKKIYEDIALRTDGDIYIGVVGPVRTGKSTFIKRFMETLVVPRIDNAYMRERARDELPQSGSGRTIMTAEPKFVPEEAVEITLDDKETLSVRLVDCVGYMADGAIGQYENGSERLVMTPWFDHEIPMSEAAELGTRKVISEHSTIGIVVTTDGSFTELPREAYLDAEERVIKELKALSKPFLILINSSEPNSENAVALCRSLSEKYEVTCLVRNCLELSEDDISSIIRSILYEFPVTELGIFLPSWIDTLPMNHPIKKEICAAIINSTSNMIRVRDINNSVKSLTESDSVSKASLRSVSLGTGCAIADIEIPRELFYKTLSEQSGFNVSDDGDLLPLLTGLSTVKSEYDRVKVALDDVRNKGYGIVMPTREELHLEEPEIVRHSGRYGVRLKASAPSIHMMMANIETEVSPVVGGERTSEGIVDYLLREFEGDAQKIWESNIFGKPLYDIASEGMGTKIRSMPEDAQMKMREALQRIINEGSGGLICILL